MAENKIINMVNLERSVHQLWQTLTEAVFFSHCLNVWKREVKVACDKMFDPGRGTCFSFQCRVALQ